MDTRTTKGPPLPDTILEGALMAWGQAGAQSLIPITGNSMLPFIRDGDQVLVVHGHTGVRRGDVIVFRRQAELGAHRVLRIYGDTDQPVFVTKGDNNPRFDPSLAGNQVLGRVVAVKRGGRYMSLDTATWRVVGESIALATLAWARFYGFGHSLMRRLVGSKANRIKTYLRPGAMPFFSLILRAFEAIACRWTDGDPSAPSAPTEASQSSPQE